MPISRMQMPRQLRRGGGIMNVVPRQGALLGGLKKAVKGVAKGIGSALKSDVGKLALLAGGAYFAPTLFGKAAGFGNFGSLLKGGLSKGLGKFAGEKTLGKTLGVMAGGTVLGGVLGSMSPEEQEEVSSGRNVSALRSKLTTAYQNLGYDESEIPTLVDNDLSEYTSGAGGYAEGGRIGYNKGTRKFKLSDFAIDTDLFNMSGIKRYYLKDMSDDGETYDADKVRDMIYGGQYASGGRVNYAMGTDQIVNQASGIMGLPQRTNKAGVKELDLRESGGFIPPVGVKEKADDIPAMLSNNEFVFTADAVRGMGDGNVNKGAQRMYDMMKKLENGGRV